MGDVLVRATRNEDSAYLIWSTSIDGPTWIFANRKEAEEHLNEVWRFTHPEYDRDGHPYTPETVNARAGDPRSPAERLRRADTYGSSSFGPSYRWEDTGFIVYAGAMAEGREPGTWLTLPRERLQRFAEALLVDDEEAAGRLLVVHREEGDGEGDDDSPINCIVFSVTDPDASANGTQSESGVDLTSKGALP